MDSNHRRREPADLQSAPVGHLGNLPTEIFPPESLAFSEVSLRQFTFKSTGNFFSPVRTGRTVLRNTARTDPKGKPNSGQFMPHALKSHEPAGRTG